VGKIAEKAVCRSVFLATCHCILNGELTKTHSFRAFFWRFYPLCNQPFKCQILQ